MSTLQAHPARHGYVSGWCADVALHRRCRGSYAGTACHCACHLAARHTAQAGVPETEPER